MSILPCNRLPSLPPEVPAEVAQTTELPAVSSPCENSLISPIMLQASASPLAILVAGVAALGEAALYVGSALGVSKLIHGFVTHIDPNEVTPNRPSAGGVDSTLVNPIEIIKPISPQDLPVSSAPFPSIDRRPNILGGPLITSTPATSIGITGALHSESESPIVEEFTVPNVETEQGKVRVTAFHNPTDRTSGITATTGEGENQRTLWQAYYKPTERRLEIEVINQDDAGLGVASAIERLKARGSSVSNVTIRTTVESTPKPPAEVNSQRGIISIETTQAEQPAFAIKWEHTTLGRELKRAGLGDLKSTEAQRRAAYPNGNARYKVEMHLVPKPYAGAIPNLAPHPRVEARIVLGELRDLLRVGGTPPLDSNSMAMSRVDLSKPVFATMDSVEVDVGEPDAEGLAPVTIFDEGQKPILVALGTYDPEKKVLEIELNQAAEPVGIGEALEEVQERFRAEGEHPALDIPVENLVVEGQGWSARLHVPTRRFSSEVSATDPEAIREASRAIERLMNDLNVAR